jgi:hypothetical protein
MNRKDDKDEWRSIPTGESWDQRAIHIGRVAAAIIVSIAALGGIGALALRYLQI